MTWALLSLSVVALFVGGCTTLPRYSEAAPAYTVVAEKSKADVSVVVHLESVFVGKRFDEVVCDNVFGAIWSPEESKKIGFTQNYAEIIPKILPLIALEASLPYNIGIGRVASGESSINLDRIKVDSRIMVPFGTYISRNVEHLLQSATRRSLVCFDQECVDQSTRMRPTGRIAVVRFTKFRVAEDKANKLTLAVQGTATVDDVSGQRRVADLKYEIIERSITSEGYFHSDFLRVMNKMANELGSAIADQILASALLPPMPNSSINADAAR